MTESVRQYGVDTVEAYGVDGEAGLPLSAGPTGNTTFRAHCHRTVITRPRSGRDGSGTRPLKKIIRALRAVIHQSHPSQPALHVRTTRLDGPGLASAPVPLESEGPCS